jgi:hypothetical protein
MCRHKFQYGKDTLDIGTAIGLADGSVKGLLSADTIERVNACQRHIGDPAKP